MADTLARVCEQVLAGERSGSAFVLEFRRATIFLQRPEGEQVRFFAHDVEGEGRWVLAFSTLDRLAVYSGGCDWMSMSGAELLADLPGDTGVLVDMQDDHRMTLPCGVAGTMEGG